MSNLKENGLTYYQKRNQQIATDEQVDFEKNYSCESRRIFELANAFIATACNNQNNWLNKYTSQNERIANNSTMLGEIDYEVKIYDDDFNSSAIDVTLLKDDEFSILIYGLSNHGVSKKDISINNIYIYEPVIKTDKETYILPDYINRNTLKIKSMMKNIINYHIFDTPQKHYRQLYFKHTPKTLMSASALHTAQVAQKLERKGIKTATGLHTAQVAQK